jgi:integrase
VNPGINKVIGWNTFRYSLASLLGSKGEGTKVVQELMRHASSKMTLDVYTYGDEDTKRLALGHMKEIFLMEKKAS